LSAFVGIGWNATIFGESISQGQIGTQLNFSADGNLEADSTNDLGISISNLQFPVWGDSGVGPTLRRPYGPMNCGSSPLRKCRL
jgi:hypothetical protein